MVGSAPWRPALWRSHSRTHRILCIRARPGPHVESRPKLPGIALLTQRGFVGGHSISPSPPPRPPRSGGAPSPSSLRPAGLPRAPRLRPRCRPPRPWSGPRGVSRAAVFRGRPAAAPPLSPCDVARGERETRPQATPKPPRKRDGRATTRENGKAKRERPKRRSGPGPGEPTGRPAHGARRTGGAPETGRGGDGQGGGLRTMSLTMALSGEGTRRRSGRRCGIGGA